MDSDWANYPEDYISVTGFVVYLGTSPVSWTAKKQKLVALSSTEAEFIALCDITREILWIQPLVESFKIKGVKENTVIHEDNLPDIKMKFVQQNLQLGNIHLVHISSVNNTADLLTNALSKKPF